MPRLTCYTKANTQFGFDPNLGEPEEGEYPLFCGQGERLVLQAQKLFSIHSPNPLSPAPLAPFYLSECSFFPSSERYREALRKDGLEYPSFEPSAEATSSLPSFDVEAGEIRGREQILTS